MSPALIRRIASLLCLVLALTAAPRAFAQDDDDDPPSGGALAVLLLHTFDFDYPEYLQLRTSLEAEGMTVLVAAPTMDPLIPQSGNPKEIVKPDLTLEAAAKQKPSAIAFVGGWGASAYQYAFAGTYDNPAYNNPYAGQSVNILIQAADASGAVLAGLGYGVSALAWARVDGVSPLKGRRVAGYPGGSPAMTLGRKHYKDGAVPTRWHVETNGGTMVKSRSVGSPYTAADDVIVDGQIITGENFESAALLGRTIAAQVRARQAPPAAAPLPVLMVIANQDFYYSEYSQTRASLEAAGLTVQVAAGEAVPSYPHTGSGYADGDGMVLPDLTIAEAAGGAADYSAVVFVGGWGASSYQYAFSGTYANAAYNGSARVRQDVNDLINAFLKNGKRVAAICHGVSVLAWARVDGVSPIANTDVLTWPGYAPAELERDGSLSQSLTREQVEENGARVLDGSTFGDPTTAADNHFFNGRFLTAQDFQAAAGFGRHLADLVLSK